MKSINLYIKETLNNFLLHKNLTAKLHTTPKKSSILLRYILLGFDSAGISAFSLDFEKCKNKDELTYSYVAKIPYDKDFLKKFNNVFDLIKDDLNAYLYMENSLILAFTDNDKYIILVKDLKNNMININFSQNLYDEFSKL